MAGNREPRSRGVARSATYDARVATSVPFEEERQPVPVSVTDGDALRDDEDAQPALGAGLRALRMRRGHTLAAVSRATGISASFLSVVENGRSDITIGRLMRLLEFYEARISDLLPGEPEPDRVVTRRGEGIELDSRTEGTHWWLLAPDTNRRMMPLMATHEPGSRIDGLPPHDGEVFIHVLEGTLLFEREGHPPFVLGPGDSAYYTGDAPPAVTTVGDETARLIGVVSPPTV